jgi:hypothetical protein
MQTSLGTQSSAAASSNVVGVGTVWFAHDDPFQARIWSELTLVASVALLPATHEVAPKQCTASSDAPSGAVGADTVLHAVPFHRSMRFALVARAF